MNRKSFGVIHPFLLAAYAVLALLANNFAYVQEGALRSLGLALLGAGALYGLLFLLIKDSLRAGLLASGVIFLLASFGHIESLIKTGFQKLDLNFPGWVLVVAYIALLVVWSFWVLMRLVDPRPPSRFLNIFSLILVIFPLYTIATARYIRLSAAEIYPQARALVWQGAGLSEFGFEEQPSSPRPDIYYLVLDAYTRADVLAELYGYNNQPFLEFLRQRGFYIAEASQANYIETELSIASSLNMAHLVPLSDFFEQQGIERWDAKDVSNDLIQHSRVASWLRQAGYTYVVFDSGVEATQVLSADEFVSAPEIRQVNSGQLAFEMLLLDTSLGKVYLDLAGKRFSALQTLFTSHRQRILFTLEHLSDYARREGDYFVFAHVISPHTPFVFGPNGEELPTDDPYTLLDAHPGQLQNVELYRGQVQYLNTLLMQTIDHILQNSKTPPVIILQGDHSSRSYKEKDPSPEVRGKLLFPILNAYLLTPSAQEQFYPQISPVNSFRVLMNDLFDLELQLLPDSGYVLDESRTRFHDVCSPEVAGAYGVCPP